LVKVLASPNAKGPLNAADDTCVDRKEKKKKNTPSTPTKNNNDKKTKKKNNDTPLMNKTVIEEEDGEAEEDEEEEEEGVGATFHHPVDDGIIEFSSYFSESNLFSSPLFNGPLPSSPATTCSAVSRNENQLQQVYYSSQQHHSLALVGDQANWDMHTPVTTYSNPYSKQNYYSSAP